MKKLLLIAGPAHTGKTTMANLIMPKIKSSCYMEMSDGLKEQLAMQFGVDKDYIDKMKDQPAILMVEEFQEAMHEKLMSFFGPIKMNPADITEQIGIFMDEYIQDNAQTFRSHLVRYGNGVAKKINGKAVWLAERLESLYLPIDGVRPIDNDLIVIGGVRLNMEVEFWKKAFPGDCFVLKLERTNPDGSMYVGISDEDNIAITEVESRTISGDFIISAKNKRELIMQGEDFAYDFLSQLIDPEHKMRSLLDNFDKRFPN